MAYQLPVRVKVMRLSADAKVPVFAMDGDACADLFATSEHTVERGDVVVVGTDIALELPSGYEGCVRARSGWGKRGMLVHPGTIDSGYRGPVGVIVANVGREPLVVKKGDRIAQLAIRQTMLVRFDLVPELSSSERGSGGFGSSGF